MPVNMKRMIAKELFSLIEERGLDKLNVRMLASSCGISRQAFYYHFRDIGDVIDWTCQEVVKELKEKSQHSPDLSASLQLYLDLAYSHRHLLLRFCESIHYAAFEKLMCYYTSAFLASILAEHWPAGLSSQEQQTYFLDFFGPALFFHSLRLLQTSHPDIKKDAQQLVHLFLSSFSC